MKSSPSDEKLSMEFDPFRVLVSFASVPNDADVFIETFTGVGLIFDLELTSREGYSPTTRIRALRPRVLTAYDALSAAGRLAAAGAAVARFLSMKGECRESLLEALAKVGWSLEEENLVAVDPKIREMFFPRGSQWDAFVALRGIISGAEKDLLVVDPYCDSTLFGLLDSAGLRSLTLRLLCRSNASGLEAEARAFATQFPQMRIELRKSSDFHDRFLIVDHSTCVHIGASLNHAGASAFMVSVVEDPRNRNALIKAVKEAWDAGAPV